MSSRRGRAGWCRWPAAGGLLALLVAACGTGVPVTPAATGSSSPTPRTPSASPEASYDVGHFPEWRALNDTEDDARIEIREGEEFVTLRVIAPHTWAGLGETRGHIDGMPDISAHLLDEACRELDSVPMVEWAGVFTIVIAPDWTLSIDVWEPGDDETVFSPPRSTFVRAMPQPPCGVDYTNTSPSPSPS